MSEALTGTLIPRVLLRALHWLGPTKEGTAVCMDCGGPHRVPIRRDSTDAAATAILEVPLRGRKGVPSVWAWLESIPIPSRASSLDLSESNCEAHAIFNPWWDNLSNTCHVLPKKTTTYAAGLVANPVARERGSVRALTWSETGVRWLRRMGLPSPPDDHNADAGDPLGRDVRKAVIEHGSRTTRCGQVAAGSSTRSTSWRILRRSSTSCNAPGGLAGTGPRPVQSRCARARSTPLDPWQGGVPNPPGSLRRVHSARATTTWAKTWHTSSWNVHAGGRLAAGSCCLCGVRQGCWTGSRSQLGASTSRTSSWGGGSAPIAARPETAGAWSSMANGVRCVRSCARADAPLCAAASAHVLQRGRVGPHCGRAITACAARGVQFPLGLQLLAGLVCRVYLA